MSSEFPLPSSDPVALNLAPAPLHHLDRLIHQHIEQGRYPRLPDRHRPTRQARAGPHLWGREDRAGEGPRHGRHAVAHVLQHQGAHDGGALELR